MYVNCTYARFLVSYLNYISSSYIIKRERFMDEKMGKRGQMTIWVIAGIAIVIGLVLLFLFRGEISPQTPATATENPKSYIDSCVNEYVGEAANLILAHGGLISPEHTKRYDGENISYLCYNAGNYYPCINEHPMLLNEIKINIKEYAGDKIERCFNEYKSEMKKRNIEVQLGSMTNFDIVLSPDKINVVIEKKLTMENKKNNYNLDKFNTEVMSPIYDLARVAMEIASQEAKYCYFEYVGYMIIYPKFNIEKFAMSDSTKIYTIEDKKTGKKLNIAIRSCAIPPGI